VLAIKEDAGKKIDWTGSAAHLLRTPRFDGSGGVKSSAGQRIMQIKLLSRISKGKE
jgi:hypothetical protein